MSDLDEISFVGSRDDVQYKYMLLPEDKGDAALNVEFFRRPHNGEEVDWVRIGIPGNPCTRIEEPVNDGHKIRFARRWHEYNGFINATGTPITQWVDEIGEAMVRDFIRNDFNYIEQVSLAPDSSLHKVAGGIGWRARALDYLNRGTPNAKQVIENQAKRIEDLEEKINTLMTMAQSSSKRQ